MIFFFSSRRRHTRFDCDWSSDVCSSDLDQHHVRVLAQDVLERGLEAAGVRTHFALVHQAVLVRMQVLDRVFDRDDVLDRKSTRLNSSHSQISYAVFCLKKKKNKTKLVLR